MRGYPLTVLCGNVFSVFCLLACINLGASKFVAYSTDAIGSASFGARHSQGDKLVFGTLELMFHEVTNIKEGLVFPVVQGHLNRVKY